MASFTDVQSVPFTPYIETNPVDAYLRVGMYKEQQLAAGIQKVQQTVDTLTGLPIMKEEDKQYLQNKLSQLKTGITKNLSGDFSDSRITNQIAGAAKQIYSDPIVQNSVQGTMAYQKGLSDIEEAKKKGTWNVANETVFQDGVNSWLSDKTVGSKSSQYFSGYTPYTDVNELFLKYWKETNPTEDMSNAYYTDKNGKPAINPVLFKGKTPAQIQAVWSLVKQNANVQQQLDIDGKYQFRGQDPSQIYQQLGAQTKADIDHNNELILNLQAKAATGDTEAAKQVRDLQAMNIAAEKSLSTYGEALKTNPDAVKAALVSQQKLSSLMGAYSYQVMEKSPLWETSFEQNRFDVQTREWEITHDLNEREFAWKQQMDQLNYSLAVDKAHKEKQAAEGIVNPAAVNPVEAVKDENTARKDVENTQMSYVQTMREVAFEMTQGTNATPPFVNRGGQWVPNIGGTSPYKTEAEVNQAAKTLIGTAKDAFINGSLTGRARELMSTGEDKYLNLQAAKKIVDDIETEFAPQTAQLASTMKDVTSDMSLLQDLIKANIVKNGLSGASGAESSLKQKYGENWEAGLGIKRHIESPNQSTPVSEYHNRKLYEGVSSRLSNNTAFTNLVAAKDAAYKNKQNVEVGYDVTLNTAKPELQKGAEKLYSSIASSIASLNESSTKGPANDILKFLAESKDAGQNVYSHYLNPITHQGSITITRGTESATLPVPESVILQHWPETSTFSAFREKFQTALNLNNGAYTGKGFSSARQAYQGAVSPYIVKYHIVGNGDGTYGVNWYVAENKGAGQPVGKFYIDGEIMGEKYGVPSQMSEEQVMQIVNSMNDKNWVEQKVILNEKLKEQNK